MPNQRALFVVNRRIRFSSQDCQTRHRQLDLVGALDHVSGEMSLQQKHVTIMISLLLENLH
jgi:hypothetical protein